MPRCVDTEDTPFDPWLDPGPAPPGAQDSPPAQRNAGPILGALKGHLPARGRVLEIASGAGRHAAVFARALPGLRWTPSDPDPRARASLEAWRAGTGAANLDPALALDCLDAGTWPDGPFDALFCANMVHISPWAATEGLMALAGRVLPRPAGLLALYGPYREAETPLAPSNAAFDADLKARDPVWGLREREAVEAAARAQGLALTLRVPMPANNLLLLFRRV